MDPDPSPRAARPRIGLVLGGGGVAGQAFHAGALTALEHDLGWDARDADVIVGTSAGAVTGALLRAGIPASGIAAWSVGTRFDPVAAIVDALGPRPRFDPLSVLDLLRPGHLPGLRLLASALRPPWQWRPLTVLLTLLHDGRRSLTTHLERLEDALTAWPAAPLWVCAVRQRDGARVVFGRDGAPFTAPAAAVAASCAVPGYFEPVVIDDARYIDGGVHSPTNADVLRAEDVDVVVIVSPMSATECGVRAGFGPGAWMRRACARWLDGERRRLEHAGKRVLVIEPDRDVVAAMGTDLMSDEHTVEVVRAAFLAAGSEVRVDDDVQDLLRSPSARGALV